MRPLFAALALLVLAASPATAQEGPVVAHADLDRAAMTLGDQALLTITVELARGYELLDPGVPRAVGDLEVVDALTALQSRLANGVTRMQLRYVVTSFELGTKRVPVIVVGYRGPGGAQGQARTQGPLVVQVQSVVAPGEDLSDIKPLKPPLPVPATGSELLPRVAIAVAALALIGIAIVAIRMRRRPPAVLEPATQGTARGVLTELERVAEMRLPEHGRTREHYDLVSAAVRRFIAGRYGLPTAARTARELRRELERAGVDRTHAELLYEVLAEGESVRYEERVIYPARAQKAMRDLMDLVRRAIVAEEYELVTSGATA